MALLSLVLLSTAACGPGDYGEPPADAARLLFLDGRATTYLGDGRVAWADQEGARLLVFGPMGGVERIHQGAPAEGPPLSDPVLGAPVRGGVAAFERDGSALWFGAEGPEAWSAPQAPVPVVAAGPGGELVAARSVLYFPLSPVSPGAPLLWLIPESEGEAVPLGEVRRPDEPRLGPLVNSGWAALHPRGEVYFAPALRPELVRLDPERGEVWRQRWTLPEDDAGQASEPTEPFFRAVNGELRPDFRIVQHAVTVGPDERVYLLASPDDPRTPDLLLVFDREGTLRGKERVPAGYAVLVDRRGGVHTESATETLSRSEGRDRPGFRPFALESLDGEGHVRLEDHQGKVVVVNFWASWCPPCRRELPLLDELHAELDPDEAVVIGLNEDARAESGRRFLAELGGVRFPVGKGEGRLRSVYGYRGLPYTVVLDRGHRVRRVFFGFGETLDPVRDEVVEALAEPLPLPPSP